MNYSQLIILITFRNGRRRTNIRNIAHRYSDRKRRRWTGLIDLTIGYSLPTIGFGVYQLDDCPEGVANALKTGYRCGKGPRCPKLTLITGDRYVLRHIDCAQFYENEAEVGEGIRRSGIPRESSSVRHSTRGAAYSSLDLTWWKNSVQGPNCGIWVRGDTKEYRGIG